MITREQLVETLELWRRDQKDELTLWQWAEEAKQQIRRQHQQEQGQVDELVRDIVDLLAALPYEMVLKDDVAVFLDALANPAEETDLSINLLWNHMDGVDVDSRRESLSNHPFYGQFYDLD